MSVPREVLEPLRARLRHLKDERAKASAPDFLHLDHAILETESLIHELETDNAPRHP